MPQLLWQIAEEGIKRLREVNFLDQLYYVQYIWNRHLMIMFYEKAHIIHQSQQEYAY